MNGRGGAPRSHSSAFRRTASPFDFAVPTPRGGMEVGDLALLLHWCILIRATLH